MFLESEIRDLRKLLVEERSQNHALSQKIQLTERQLAIERLCVCLVITPSRGMGGSVAEWLACRTQAQ